MFDTIFYKLDSIVIDYIFFNRFLIEKVYHTLSIAAYGDGLTCSLITN